MDVYEAVECLRVNPVLKEKQIEPEGSSADPIRFRPFSETESGAEKQNVTGGPFDS